MHRILFFFSTLLIVFPVFAQFTAPVVTLKNVVEQRDSRRGATNTLLLSFEVEGSDEEGRTLRRISLDPVVDDAGDVLEPGSRLHSRYTTFPTLDVEISAPARTATALKEVRGELLIFQPSRENGGEVVVINASTRFDKDLLDGKVAGLQIIQLSEKARLAAKEAESRERIAGMQTKLDSLRQMGEAGEGIAEMILQLTEQLSRLGDSIGGNGAKLYLSVEGDVDRLVNVSVLEAGGGKSIKGGFSSGTTYNLKRALTAGDEIHFQIETPESVTRYPFSIGSVPLQ